MAQYLQPALGIGLLVLLAEGGRAIAPRLPVAVPGPVVGLVLHVLLLTLCPWARDGLLKAARLLIGLLGGFIVPAAVGLAAFSTLIADALLPLALAIVGSTLVTGLVTAAVYRALDRR